MWMRRLGLVGIAAFVMAVAAPAPAHALFISDAFGFDNFAVNLIDQFAHTIEVTEDINAPVAGFTLNFVTQNQICPEVGGCIFQDDRNFAWQITKHITNETGTDWTNFDNELKVPGQQGFISSNDFDGTSFDQGNQNRVIDSIAFSGLFVDEFQERDFLQFQTGSVLNTGVDTQTFPVTSFSITTVQLVQTPNFQNPDRNPIPEPTSMLLFGMGSLGAGLVRRRKFSNV